jgi:hypothetical protein
MKWRILSIGLAFLVLFAPLSALPSPSPSPSSVVLSQAEYDQIEAAILQAQEALRKSNEEIARLSRDLTLRSTLCGLLAGALVLNGVALIIEAVK